MKGIRNDKIISLGIKDTIGIKKIFIYLINGFTIKLENIITLIYVYLSFLLDKIWDNFSVYNNVGMVKNDIT